MKTQPNTVIRIEKLAIFADWQIVVRKTTRKGLDPQGGTVLALLPDLPTAKAVLKRMKLDI